MSERRRLNDASLRALPTSLLASTSERYVPQRLARFAVQRDSSRCHTLRARRDMSCTDAATDRNNAFLANADNAKAKALTLSFGAYMN